MINNIIYIYYSDVSGLNIDKHIESLPYSRKQKVLNYHFEKDKKLSIGVYLLLKKALQLNNLDIDNYDFYYDKNGKPFLKDCPYYFSLSHSKDFVAVCLSKDSVGVDIQEEKQITDQFINFICNENDLLFYNSAKNKLKAFYKIWTFKESYLKMTGEGLNKSLKKIDINYSTSTKQPYFKNYLKIQGYQLSICNLKSGVTRFKKIVLK